jgi:hypothetical protein
MQYESLDPASKAIRLLTLLPAEDGDDDTCRCTLHQASLSNESRLECPPYKAVSYAWDDSALPVSKRRRSPEIICNNELVRISANLDALLKRLRCLARRSQCLWVDSLCINQHDAQERRQQVLMMREIFSRSEEVIIWLGETSSSLQGAGFWSGNEDDDGRISAYLAYFDEHSSSVSLSRPGFSSYHERRAVQEETDHVGAFCLLSLMCQGKSSADVAFYEPRITSSRRLRWSSSVKAAILDLAERAWVRLVPLFVQPYASR